MVKQLLVRNVPDPVQRWIDRERLQQRMSQQEFVLSVLKRASMPDQTLPLPFPQHNQPLLPPASDLPFTFIDLFAGVGGFRIALESLGGRALFSSEWDKYSQKTYKAWFNEIPHGDITRIRPSEIPDHDVLDRGFAAQCVARLPSK